MRNYLLCVLVLGTMLAGSAARADQFVDGYNYEKVSHFQIYERATTVAPIPAGFRNVMRYMLATGDHCTVVNSAVQTSLLVAPTRYIRYLPLVDNGSAYVYSVNNDQGAPLQGIQVSMGAVGGPIVQDICGVDIYFSYGPGNGVPPLQ